MAQITRLLSAQLAKALGIRETGGLLELADTIVPVLSIEPYLMAPDAASPAPILPGGLEPVLHTGTGVEAIAASTNENGFLEFFGAAFVSGTNPANRYSRNASPPNRDWLLHGALFFMAMARGGFVEMNCGIQANSVQGPGEQILLRWDVDNHEVNGNFEASRQIMVPVPYYIAAARQLYFRWEANNLEAVIRNVEIRAMLFWSYA